MAKVHVREDRLHDLDVVKLREISILLYIFVLSFIYQCHCNVNVVISRVRLFVLFQPFQNDNGRE